MSFELVPDPGDRGEPDVKLGRLGGSLEEGRRLVRDGVQVLARGSLACPECDLPIWPAPRIHPRSELRCAFCDHSAEARTFLGRQVGDTDANQVAVVARIH